MNDNLGFDHTALAELISRRWQEERPYFALDGKAPGAWLEGSWWRHPPDDALKLHWSRRSPQVQVHTVFPRATFQETAPGDPV